MRPPITLFILLLFSIGFANFGIAQHTSNYSSFFSTTAPSYYKGKTEDNSIEKNTSIRTIDGSGNNQALNDYGKTHITFERLVNANYQADGYSMVNNLPNPRHISNMLCAQTGNHPSSRNLSMYMFTWLQFLDHDITLTEISDNDFAPIPVPQGDPFFDPANTGTQVIPFTRVAFADNTGISANPRQQINEITAWIDGSNVYGADQFRADWLRSFQQGKLKVSPSSNGDLLPCNTTTGDCNDPVDTNAPFSDGEQDRCGNPVKVFVAGDVRANEQPGLTALHTLFVREHNRICDELVANGQTNDEENYQYARRMVIGMLQSITYNEVLPALGIQLNNYSGYQPNTSPNIFNEFATAAYRLGHTMIASHIPFLNEDCTNASSLSGCGSGTVGIFGGANCLSGCGSTTMTGAIELRDAFFNPSILGNNGLETILLGLSTVTQQEVDLQVVDDVRNFLFGAPGSGGLDLAAVNIHRGRDHGLADFNSIRTALGLSSLTSFNQITSNTAVANALASVYQNDINAIDAWIGMLAEDHLPNSEVGPCLHALLKLQFENIRDADRFWFEHDNELSNSEKTAIGATRLADIVKKNTTLNNLSDVFFTENCQTQYCTASGANTNYEYIDKVVFGSINNTSGNNGGYGDYSNLSTTIGLNEEVNLELTPQFAGSAYTEHWSIWIDFNQNSAFEDSERIYNGQGITTLTDVVTIPANAPLGTTRMRVAMRWNSNPANCGSIPYGEVEDYTVEIVEDNCATTGQACDDNDTCTVNDVYDSDCNCVGTFQDSDNDGSCDADDPCPNDPNNNCGNATYCTTSGSNTNYEYIQSIVIGTINNSSGNDGGYANYTNLSTIAAVNSSLNVVLTPGFSGSAYNEYWSIWIDLNQDGDFEDANELVFSTNGITTMSGSFEIPNNALSGSTRMRVSMKWNSAPPPCGGFTYGEIEDYTIQITNGGVGCNLVGQACNDGDDCTQGDVYDANCNCVGFYQDSDNDGSCDADDPCPNDPTNDCIMLDYCTAAGANTNFEHIANVVIGSINNTSGNDGGYADYTNMSTNAALGQSIAISLTPGFGNSSYEEYWRIWIDFNKDGDFEDAGEIAFEGSSETTITGNINIPNNALTGSTRMRVSMKWNSYAAPCGGLVYGEVEDYMINIGASASLRLENSTLNTIEQAKLSIFPNPIQAGKTLTIEYFTSTTQEGTFFIFNNLGQLIKEIPKVTSAGKNEIVLSTNDLNAGYYQLIYQSKTERTSVPFIVIHL